MSSYFSPNYSIFSIYFFLNYFFILKNAQKILKIIFINIFLSIPALYYIFVLDIHFLKLGLTPGSSLDLNIESVELNLSNKIFCIVSIVFFYTFPILYNMKDKFEKNYKNFFIVLSFIIIYLYCILNFNYELAFTGGGIILHISNYLFKNNFFFYLVNLFAFYYLFVKKFNLNNFGIILILIFSNPQLTIYHKYYDPLILILIFTLFKFKIDKDFFNKLNILLLYSIYIFFMISKITQNYLNIL